MCIFRLRGEKGARVIPGVAVALTLGAFFQPCPALDKPTGAPLEISTIETEQAMPLVFLDLDGKTAHCASVKLHWNPNTQVGPNEDATSFALDVAADSPGASVFTAQLWKASLASALAWQEPWQGARWKILQTPATDGTGISAALAVGMISTSARRPYPEKTVVIGSLNPDGSLGPVSHLIARMDAAATAGMTRIIIPDVQRFDTDSDGQVVNMMRHADELHLECVPVDNIVEATETTMNDPLPEPVSPATTPRYSTEVASYIDVYAHREETVTSVNLKFAPKEADLGKYPPRLAALWKTVYADGAAGQQAYRAGQVYTAYRLLSRANSTMDGINALIGQNRASFDVKAALSESDDLRNHLHVLMNPPAIDKGELQSAVLVAEMADWAYEINASIEGAQLVTKQTFSQRSDATGLERDRAREAILFANEQGKYLLSQADFFDGLLTPIGKGDPISVDENATHLLPQLIPAQLATAQIFTDGIKDRANDLRVGLLFDPRLVAYVGLLGELKADWDSTQRKKEMEAQAAPPPAAPTPGMPDANSTNQAPTPAPPEATPAPEPVAFDPGNTYRPPHTIIASSGTQKKVSDVAQCLIWVNNDCEIATLDEKYLRLSGVIDPATHEWHVKDRAKLDALLQSAETGARQGIAYAEKAEVDPSVLAMIYERASYLRIQTDDASALEALRNYWRCALLGNLCWQLAHSHKAQPVDLGSQPAANSKESKETKKSDQTVAKGDESTKSNTATTHIDTPPPPPVGPVVNTPPAVTNTIVAEDPPVAPVAHENEPPRATPVVLPAPDNQPANPAPVSTPTPAPVSPAHSLSSVAPNDADGANIPVAPVAKVEDYSGTNTAPTASPVTRPVPPAKSDNADGHSAAFP